MTYKEYHFDSDGATRSDRSTRANPIFELNDLFDVRSFSLRHVELPLTWLNVPREAFTMSFFYQITATGQEVEWRCDPLTVESVDGKAQHMSLTEFVDQLNVLMPLAVWNNIPPELVPPPNDPTPDTSTPGNLTATVLTDNRVEFFVAGACNDGFLFPSFGATVVRFKLNWGPKLARLMNKNFYDTAPCTSVTLVTQALSVDDATEATQFPVQLIPNYIFLHSNLMTATPYGSTNTPSGGFASRTVMSKIAIDQNYDWSTNIMTHNRESYSSEFFYTISAPFSQIEFWFTDQLQGEALDFQNVPFSLTLATMS
jgi:hypothetical protein